MGSVGLDDAARGAPVAVHGVAVVALLAGVDVAVAAAGRLLLDGADRGAIVAVHGVAVVALLAVVDVSVTADGLRRRLFDLELVVLALRRARRAHLADREDVDAAVVAGVVVGEQLEDQPGARAQA